MKTHEEMAQDVLDRIKKERIAKKKRMRIAISGISVMCICLAAAIIIGSWGRDTATVVEAADLMSSITAEAVNEKEADAIFKKNQMRLALELFRETSEESRGENLLISPLSIQLALAMTANGADGTTLTEMERVLGGDIPLDTLNEYLYSYTNSLPSEEKAKLNIANSIWFRDTLEVKQSFLQKNADYYKAAAYRSAFDEVTVKDINNWVKDNTDGMIDEIIDEIDPLTMMYLINAIVFDGKWEESYSENDVRNSNFYAYGGDNQDAEMMYSTEDIFLNDGNATGFMKPYSGGKYSFAALLPNEGIDVYDYIAGLTPAGMADTFKNAINAEVDVYLPKFSYEYKISMNDILSHMGMPTAFAEGVADFSRISDISLFISDVLHKTFITVDENGTKAAAVTIVNVKTESCVESYTVRLDRPFVYMIVDNKTNLPVFIGVLTGITE